MSQHENASGSDSKLSPHEVFAFEELKLAAGDWVALFAMPFIAAAWRDNFMEELERRKLRSVIEEALTWKEDSVDEVASIELSPSWQERRDSFFANLTFNDDATDSILQRVRIGADLLAWYLAHHCSHKERHRLLECVELTDVRYGLHPLEMKDAIRELRLATDKYLACSEFTYSAPEVTLPTPAAKELSIKVATSWESSLITPLAKLVWEAQGNSYDLRNRMEDAIAASLSRRESALAGMLNDSGWLDVFYYLTNSPKERVEQRFAPCARQFVEGLATLPLNLREVLFDELQLIAESLSRRSVFRPGQICLAMHHIESIFEPLVSLIETARLDFANGVVPKPDAESDVDLDTNKSPWEPPVVHPPQSVSMVSWDECIELSKTPGKELAETAIEQPRLFSQHQVDGQKVIIVPEKDAVPESLWFVGDIHCDLITMANAWSFICDQSASKGVTPHVVFLGDFLDRGLHGIETVAFLFRLLAENPGQIAVLMGNHDEFSWNEEAQRFQTTVEPAETIDQLNQHAMADSMESRPVVEFGKMAAKFFADAPRAIFLPDGTMVSHGGFPHADLLDSLNSTADLNSDLCLEDFVWLRSANVKRRLPARFSRGAEFGYENFVDFCSVATERLGIPVQRFVRGHDHVAKRYECHADWPLPVLTINSMGRNTGEYGVQRFPMACIARHRFNQLPEIYPLRLGHSELERAYPIRNTDNEG